MRRLSALAAVAASTSAVTSVLRHAGGFTAGDADRAGDLIQAEGLAAARVILVLATLLDAWLGIWEGAGSEILQVLVATTELVLATVLPALGGHAVGVLLGVFHAGRQIRDGSCRGHIGWSTLAWVRKGRSVRHGGGDQEDVDGLCELHFEENGLEERKR